MSGLMVLQYALLLLAGSAVTIAFVLLFWLHRRLKGGSRQPVAAVPFQNMIEMSILFQTMRGLVRDQRTLAREFNRSADTKIKVVREALNQVMAGHEQLMRMQRELKTQIAQASGRLDRDGGETPRVEDKSENSAPALRAIATPEEADFIDTWPGYDAAGDGPDGAVEPIPAPESDRDPEVAREAFRALLNMGEPPETDDDEPKTAAMAAASERPSNGNGAAALRSRVYKYHDAGMSINAIAQELGVGKGEIRLMLTLRNK